MFEVYPGVRVAADEDSEEEGAQRGGEKHHHQPEESLVTRRHQRSVIQPGTRQYTITKVTILLPTVPYLVSIPNFVFNQVLGPQKNVFIYTSVADPDPSDPYVFGLPGSGS